MTLPTNHLLISCRLLVASRLEVKSFNPGDSITGKLTAQKGWEHRRIKLNLWLPKILNFPKSNIKYFSMSQLEHPKTETRSSEFQPTASPLSHGYCICINFAFPHLLEKHSFKDLIPRKKSSLAPRSFQGILNAADWLPIHCSWVRLVTQMAFVHHFQKKSFLWGFLTCWLEPSCFHQGKQIIHAMQPSIPPHSHALATFLPLKGT